MQVCDHLPSVMASAEKVRVSEKGGGGGRNYDIMLRVLLGGVVSFVPVGPSSAQ